VLLKKVNDINFSILAIGIGVADVVGHQENHQLFKSETISGFVTLGNVDAYGF